MKLIGILIAGVVGVAGAADPDPVMLKIHFEGPTGPLMRFPVRASNFRCGEGTTFGDAWTDVSGDAEFHIDRTLGDRVYFWPAWGAFSDLKLREDVRQELYQRFRETRGRLVLHTDLSIDIAGGAREFKKSFTLPKAIHAHFKIQGHDSKKETPLDLVVPEDIYVLSEFDRKMQEMTVEGIPAGREIRGYFRIAIDDHVVRSVRVLLPSSLVDVNLGTIAAPSLNIRCKVVVKEDNDRRLIPVRVKGTYSDYYTTLISSDAMTILSAEKQGHGLTARFSVPPGTYYYVPGEMTAAEFQVTMIEWIAAGKEVPSAFPRVTVAAGEEKTIQVNEIDVINAIFELPGAGK